MRKATLGQKFHSLRRISSLISEKEELYTCEFCWEEDEKVPSDPLFYRDFIVLSHTLYVISHRILTKLIRLLAAYAILLHAV